jgi:hypothetical protein
MSGDVGTGARPKALEKSCLRRRAVYALGALGRDGEGWTCQRGAGDIAHVRQVRWTVPWCTAARPAHESTAETDPREADER